ncbi:uncharacterized protein LOC133833863 isoform X1 [Humulus lupulus]|uniref:uncharacterized protein LOC133833863 isoform X1 n=1 Tax=Humulus lupulus TaxID=3486 RepID=UPI002B40AF4C|nr:uncharacterized protein LOC133833863 isoform X1 [Humulus lupulus]
MTAELLPTVITSIQKRIEVGFPFRNDQTGLLTASFSCLTAAFTISPSSTQVKEVLLKEMNEGFIEAEKKPGVLLTLFHYLEKVNNHTVCLEALQVRAASVTCFAGITSSIFFSLAKEKHDFILSAAINAAKQDEVPSVRSASCRAIGVISCFPEVFQRCE